MLTFTAEPLCTGLNSATPQQPEEGGEGLDVNFASWYLELQALMLDSLDLHLAEVLPLHQFGLVKEVVS